MSSQVRKRKDASIPVKAKDPSATGIASPRDHALDALVKANMEQQGGKVEWDYRIALSIITVLAFITRFWGISHPNEVVFDEVHFGKVRPVFRNSEGVNALVLTSVTVCVLLSRANVLLRCPSSFWEVVICPHGLVRGI